MDYGYAEVLLNGVLNMLRVVSWQLAGDEEAPFPEPIPMPGQSAPDVGIDAMSIEEMDARLARYMPGG